MAHAEDYAGKSAPTSAEEMHGDLVGQPHLQSEPEPIVAAEEDAARIRTDSDPLGTPGPKFDRRSPFFIGLTGAAGVAVTYGLVEVLIFSKQVLILVGVALFLAIGIEPAVSWLVQRRLPRWAALTLVFVIAFGALAGFLAAAIPPLIDQGTALVHNAPDRLDTLEQNYPSVKSLSDRFQLHNKLDQGVGADSSALVGGVIGAGKVLFSAITSVVVLIVLTAYFSANFPRIRSSLYRLFPRSRRPRAILLGDEIFAKVGGYVLGNLVISVITATATYIWLLIFHVPYPLALAVLVAVLDLIPVVGSTLAGIIIAVVALTVSVPVSLATIGFFLALRLLEDYLLIPKIIGRTVKVPALVTVVAVLAGGALLGVVGALLAIPVAAALLLLAEQTLLPRLDRQ
ncbi:AI-2E family transporter [Rhodococcus erythropolis]